MTGPNRLLLYYGRACVRASKRTKESKNGEIRKWWRNEGGWSDFMGGFGCVNFSDLGGRVDDRCVYD